MMSRYMPLYYCRAFPFTDLSYQIPHVPSHRVVQYSAAIFGGEYHMVTAEVGVFICFEAVPPFFPRFF